MKTKNIFTLLTIFLCSPFIGGSQIILQEGFEGSQFPPLNWTEMVSDSINQAPYNQSFPYYYETWFQAGVGAPGSWSNMTYVHSGDNAAVVGGTVTNVDPYHDWLITDTISIPNTTNDVKLSYWMWYQSATPDYFTHFYIMLKRVNDNTWSEIEHQYHPYSASLHYDMEYQIDLNAYRGEDIMLAFVKNSSYQFALDDILIEEMSNVSISENDNFSLIGLFPNPATDNASLLLDSKQFENALITLTNIHGKTSLRKPCFLTIGENHISLNTSDLAKGIYFVKVSSSTHTSTYKLILQ